MAFTKLFSSIITSTIWTEDDQTRIVWITMLALADRNGEVQGSVPGLARLAGVPVDACRAALATFLAPDPDSRTKDDEGRRIEEIDGGWLLLNYAKYRQMASKEEQVQKATERTRRYRAKKARNVASTPVSTVCDKKSTGVHDNPTEAEAEADNRYDIAAKAARPPLGDAAQIFNSAAKEVGWAQVQLLGPERKAALTKCLKAVGGLEGWKTLLAKASASDFLSGRTVRAEGHVNWMPDFDFIVKRHVKIMEGGYDNRNGTHQPERGLGAALAALAD